MERIILLAASAVFVAACAVSQQSPTVFGSSGTAKPAASAFVQVSHNTPAVPENVPWAIYREFNFDSSSSEVSISDTPKLREIVAYVASNSTLDIGIDGTLGRDGISQAERDLSTRRAASVRRALMDTGAGIASYKIQMGPFGDPEHRRPGQIQVLIGPRTGSPQSPL